ncbi:MAG: PKD domain-containing protein, partial [Thermoplasmata archaeon]
TFEDLPATLVHYRLLARDEAGNVVEASSTVSSTQDDETPKVFISVDPALEAEEGEEVTFDATDSTDDNGIASYEWDFESDGTVDSTEAETTWTYEDAGSYQVTVIITDLAGNEAVYSDYTISILDISPPDIDLDIDPGTTVDEGTTVTFDASGTSDASGIQVVRWFLDGDAVPLYTGYVAEITFDVPGSHEVKVEAVDNWDNVADRTVMITVNDITAPAVTFSPIGPMDNTKVEFFTIYVNVTDSGGVTNVVLFYKTQDAGVFSEVDMIRSMDDDDQWYKDELAPGPKGNATYYVRATDASGNEVKTDYQRIQVTGVEDPSPPGTNGDGGFDIMDYLWLIILLVIIVVVAVAAVAISGRRKAEPKPTKKKAKATKAAAAKAKPKSEAKKAPSVVSQQVAAETIPAKDKALCAIEEVYFIHNDGRLILAASSSAAADRDAQDVFAGMFTAIQDFIKDSMSQKGDLGSFDYGDNRIIIERGRHITCAVTIFGTEPGKLRDEVREVVRQVEGNYAGVIERWDGDKAKLGGITEFAKRILGITGGIDRATVIKATEKKGVKLLSEVEFFQGFVRLKTAVKNDTETVITDAALDIVYDDNVLRLDHIQPVYEYKRGKVHLGNINAGEKKTVAFNYDPIICMESNIDGNLTFRDVKGSLQVVSMKTRRADIVCPIFFTRENANTAML